MKKLNFLIFLVLLATIIKAQPCLPGGYTFNTQAKIDSFQVNYPGCNEIQGHVYIQGGDITSLEGLSTLQKVNGDLRIKENYALTSLTGLNNLYSIQGNLEIIRNHALTDLSGLENLSYIGYNCYIKSNNFLTDLSGLESMNKFNYNLDIDANYSLSSLNGLDAETIIHTLRINNNHSLMNLNGLDSLSHVGALSIYYNDQLASLEGPDSLYIKNALRITNNPSLVSCDNNWLCNLLQNPACTVDFHTNGPGCNNVVELALACGGLPCLPYGNYQFYSQYEIDQFQNAFYNCSGLNGNVTIQGDDIISLTGLGYPAWIGGSLRLLDNASLTDLAGLDSIQSIGNCFTVENNNALVDLSGLNALSSIQDTAEFAYNSSLVNLHGLEKLELTYGPMFIHNNTSLLSLQGLNNVYKIYDRVEIYSNPLLQEITAFSKLRDIRFYLDVNNNPSLLSLAGLDSLNIQSMQGCAIYNNNSLSFCAVKSMCDYLANGANIYFGENAHGCNNNEQVEEACLYVSIEEMTEVSRSNVFPNPTDSEIRIETTSTAEKVIRILNMQGKSISVLKTSDQNPVMDISQLPAGIYMVQITIEEGIQLSKFVKE